MGFVDLSTIGLLTYYVRCGAAPREQPIEWPHADSSSDAIVQTEAQNEVQTRDLFL